MKNTKCGLVLALALIAFVARPAHADSTTTYDINFTTVFGGPAPVSGSFTYDSTNPGFTNFLVSWNGVFYDFTASANSTVIHGTGCTGETSGAAYSFAMLTQTLSGCSPGLSYLAVFTTAGNTVVFNELDFRAIIDAAHYDEIQVFPAAPGVTPGVEYQGSWLIQAVPEPQTFWLLSTGLLGLVGAVLLKRLA